jgi:Uma2 family endonuclease
MSATAMSATVAEPRVANPLTFVEFLAWDDGTERSFELRDGFPMPISEPNAKHEDLVQRLCAYLDAHCLEKGCPYVPRQSKQIWLGSNPTTGREESRKADIVAFSLSEWERMRSQSSSAAAYTPPPLEIEVVSTNWADDYDTKLLEYEALGIAEYWIADYAALGGIRYIGKPKQPTITVNYWVDGEYQSKLFIGSDSLSETLRERIQSLILTELELTAEQIFAMAG